MIYAGQAIQQRHEEGLPLPPPDGLTAPAWTTRSPPGRPVTATRDNYPSHTGRHDKEARTAAGLAHSYQRPPRAQS